jgi:hypothetical protein
MESYLQGSAASFRVKSFDGTIPSIGLCQSPVETIGHMSMVLGRAETNPFGALKKQYNIVVFFNRNFLGAQGSESVNMGCRNTMYRIESRLRRAQYGLPP